MQLPLRYGPYDVHERLGDGGTGVVMRCVHRNSGLPAAVKVSKTAAAAEREALRREIGILSRLSRSQVQGVVRLLEHGGADDNPWYAMELLQGQSMRQWRQRLWSRVAPSTNHFDSDLTRTTDVGLMSVDAPPSLRVGRAQTARTDTAPPVAAGQLDRVLRVFLRLSEILVQLHAEGVVHGDLAPANIVFRDETDPVVIDFGAALTGQVLDGKHASDETRAARGTAGYLAPELITGQLFDTRCDLYALGCMLYEVSTGRSAFSGTHIRDVLRQQLHSIPLAPSACVIGMPERLEVLIRSLLEKDPRRRLARADDVCEALRACMSGTPRARQAKNAPALFKPRLFGRTQALTALESQLASALQGRGGLALVAGESGIGKTRLMSELGVKAARGGSRVLWARSSNSSAQGASDSVPAGAFELFMPVLDELLEHESSESTPQLDDFRIVARIATRLAARVGSADMGELAPDVVIRHGFTAFARLLARAARTTGLLVLIDDLQWADELSLRFIAEWAGSEIDDCVLLVANYRSEELAKRGEQLVTHARCHVLLTRLDGIDTRAMVADLLATDPIPETMLSFLDRQAEGNPFFVGEYTRAAIAQGLLHRLPDGGWHFEPGRAHELDVPQSIAVLFRARIQQLSERARDALQLASLLEREFRADTFRALLGFEIDYAEVLEELVARDVFAPCGPGRYRFVHDKLREAQASALEPDERRRHHIRVAQHLEATTHTSISDIAAAAGYHWACAGEPQRALIHLVPAARSAAESGHALARAAELFGLALRQCEQLPDRAAMRLQLREQLADVLVRQALYREARACLDQLLCEYDATDRVARARAWRKAANTHWVVHNYAAAGAALDRAECELAELRASDSAATWSEAIQVRLERCQQLYFAGQIGSEHERLVRELEPAIERYGTPDQACAYYGTAASYVMLLKRYAFDPQAVSLAERGLLASRTLPAARVAFAHFILAYTLTLGTVEQCRVALDHYQQAQERAQHTGDAILLSRVLTYDALTCLRLGDVQRTAAAARVALEAAHASQIAPYIAAAQCCQGWVAWRQGAAASAELLLQTARNSWRGHPHKFPFQSLAAFPLIDLAHVRDDFEQIRELLTEVQGGLPALPDELERSISAAIDTIDVESGRRASESIAEVLRLARVCAYA